MAGHLPILLAAGAAVLLFGRKRRSRPARAGHDPHGGELEAAPAGLNFDTRPLCSPSLGSNEDEDLVGCLSDSELEPRGFEGIAMAQGHPLCWPVVTDHPRGKQASYFTKSGSFRGWWGRNFGAKRKRAEGPDGRHAGNDLAGYQGDVVVAAQDGEIIALLPFYKGTWALYLKTDDGLILNYGEIDNDSWKEFSRRTGDRVSAGEPLARIGHHLMLHFETYRAEPDTEKQIKDIRAEKYNWYGTAADANPGLLDPTQYLVEAQLAQARIDAAINS